MLFRISLATVAVVLALAACEQATPVDDKEPDTAPKFSGTVDDQEPYKVLQAIEALTLPRARGGNGTLRYSLEPVPDGLSFDPATRTLSGTPHPVEGEKVYHLTYRVRDEDGDSDTIKFTITVRPDTILENVVTGVAVAESVGQVRFRVLPVPSGGPAISVAGNRTMMIGGSFFLDVVPTSSAPIDTLLVSIEKEPAGYYEIDVAGSASSYRLVGAVPYDLDPTRTGSSVGLCVTPVHAIDRVGETQCHRVYIAEADPGDVRITLSWDGDSDLDLEVVDPEGVKVRRGAVHGEQASVTDSNQGCDLVGAVADGIRNEHVAWKAGSVTPGVYTVRLNYQASCGVAATHYVLRVIHGGETSTFFGRLTGPGNYNEFVTTLTVAGGDTPPTLSGETLTYTGGDQAFILNPNGEILDGATFSLNLGAAEAEVYVIASNSAHHPVKPRVELPGQTSNRAAGRLIQAAADASSMVPQRAWVTQFNNGSELPLAGSCRPHQVAQGAKFTFRDYDASLGQTVDIPATRRKVVADGTTTLTVWVADASWETCSECVSAEMVEAVAQRFLQPNEDNDVYGLVTAIFGEPWGSHDRQCLLPAETSIPIHILLYDVVGDLADAVEDEQRTRGFFAAKDNFLQNPSDPIIDSSNERLLLYLDAPLLAQKDGPSWEIADYWPRQMISTLAHELQHMIHFYQKRVRQGARSEAWLNEMASAVAEDLVVYNLALPGLDGPRAVPNQEPTAGNSGISVGPLPLYNLHNDIEVTRWDGTLRSSSIGYALGAYLARTYGGAALFRDIVQSDLEGVKAIEEALRVGHTFGEVLVNWGIANLLSDNDGLPATDPYRYYRYNRGDWSTSREGGTRFELGSINLYHYRHQADSFVQEGPFLYSIEGFNARTQPPHSNMYAKLEPDTGTVRLRVDAVRDNRIAVVVKEVHE